MAVKDAADAQDKKAKASRTAWILRLRMETEFERGAGIMLQWLLLLLFLLWFLMTGSILETSYDARESIMRTLQFDSEAFSQVRIAHPCTLVRDHTRTHAYTHVRAHMYMTHESVMLGMRVACVSGLVDLGYAMFPCVP